MIYSFIVRKNDEKSKNEKITLEIFKMQVIQYR